MKLERIGGVHLHEHTSSAPSGAGDMIGLEIPCVCCFPVPASNAGSSEGNSRYSEIRGVEGSSLGWGERVEQMEDFQGERATENEHEDEGLGTRELGGCGCGWWVCFASYLNVPPA